MLRMLWIYQLPIGLLAAIVLGLAWIYTLGGVLLFRPWVKSWRRSENETVGAMLSIAGVAYAVLLAMIAVGAWNGASTVDVAIQQEANALTSVYRGVGAFRPAARDHFRQLIADYVDFVVRDEWPALGRNTRSPRTELASRTLSDELISFDAATPAEQMLKPGIIDQMNQFEDARRLRILAGLRGLDGVTWFVVLIGGMLTLAFTFFFRTESFRLHLTLAMLSSGMLAVVVFLILAMDHPLWGTVSVKPDALREVLHSVGAVSRYGSDTTATDTLSGRIAP
jgi:hypothetical protein